MPLVDLRIPRRMRLQLRRLYRSRALPPHPVSVGVAAASSRRYCDPRPAESCGYPPPPLRPIPPTPAVQSRSRRSQPLPPASARWTAASPAAHSPRPHHFSGSTVFAHGESVITSFASSSLHCAASLSFHGSSAARALKESPPAKAEIAIHRHTYPIPFETRSHRSRSNPALISRIFSAICASPRARPQNPFYLLRVVTTSFLDGHHVVE